MSTCQPPNPTSPYAHGAAGHPAGSDPVLAADVALDPLSVRPRATDARRRCRLP